MSREYRFFSEIVKKVSDLPSRTFVFSREPWYALFDR